MVNPKKLLALLVLSSYLTALPAFAEEVDVDDDGEGDYVELKEQESAPFDGFLLHKNAMVKLITDREQELGKLKLHFDTELKKKDLDIETLTKKKEIELNINKEMHESLLKIKQDRIDQLVSEQKWSDVKLISGVVIGFAVSIAMFYAAVQVAK